MTPGTDGLEMQPTVPAPEGYPKETPFDPRDSNLCRHAEKELRAAGLFDNDADYGGMVAPAVQELIETFARQRHIGYSAHLVADLFYRLARYHLLTPLKNPIKTGEYIFHDEDGSNSMQSTRLSSVFSNDGGKTWYDIYRPNPWWKRWYAGRFESPRFAE